MCTEGRPDQLAIPPLFLCTPIALKLVSHFMWNDDNESLGSEWMERVLELGKIMHNTVRNTTILAGMRDFDSAIPPDGRGSVNTISLRSLTDDSIAAIAKYVECMPKYAGTGFVIYVAPEPSAASLQDSVSEVTESHYMLELLGTPRS